MNEKKWDTNEKIGEYLEKKITDVFIKNQINTQNEFIKNTKSIHPQTYYSEFCKRLIQAKQFAYPSNTLNKITLLPDLPNDEYQGLLVCDWSEVENLLKEGLSLEQSIIKLVSKFNDRKEH